MPYVRRRRVARRPYKVRRTRRTYKAIRPRVRRTTRRHVRSKWVAPITQRKNICFVYSDTDFTFSGIATATPSEYIFRGNSLYDPDATGVGVQPYGFDQYFPSLYYDYRVAASKITVYVHMPKVVSTLRLAVFPFFSTSPNTDLADVDMVPYCRMKTFSAGNGRMKLSNYITTRQMFPNVARDSNEQCVYNSNPTRQWYWHVSLTYYDSVIESTDLIFDVKIKYYSIVTRFGNYPDES